MSTREAPLHASHSQAEETLFVGGGEMGERMRAFDWASSPLGPVANWPQSLRAAVSLCLASRFPIILFCGADLIQLYNDAYRSILGPRKHPHALGQPAREYWPEVWDRIGPMLANVLASGEATWLEDALFPIDRHGALEESYFTFSYGPIREESGRVIGVFTTIVEVTQRIVSEHRLQTLIQATNDVVWEWDLGTGKATWNESMQKLFGYTPEQIGPDTTWWYAHIHPEDRDRVVTHIHALIDGGGELWSEEYRYQRADGSYAHVLDRGSILRDPQGKAMRMLGAMLDITARKQAEEALQASERRFRSLIENSADAIALFGTDGLILYGSPSTWRALGYALEEFVGRSAFELIHPDDHAFVRGQLAESLRQPGTGVPVQAWVRHKSGSWRWLEGSFTNLLAEPGVQAIVNNYRDMTERKRAEKELARQAAELQRSNTELEQFAYIASHDLQEPLRTVNNFTQLLAKRYQGNLDADADEFMGYITEGATRMQQLIRDLLAYSQVGKQGQEFTPTDCEAVLERTLHMLQMRIEESGGQVTHAPLPTLAVDAGQLEQLFQNLIGNALKFRGPEPPRVHVSAQQNGRQWVFSVRDNGIGLDPQQAERIFQVFQRLHTRKAYPGTGIGLAICKKIVEQHGGRIWVESQPGQGATFFFTISDMGGGVNLLTRRVMNPYFSS